MIGLSIVALLVMNTEPVARPDAVAHTSTVPVMTLPAFGLPSLRFPSIRFPHIPMPRFRMPSLPKRNGDAESLALVAKRLDQMVSEQEQSYADHGRYVTHPAPVAAAAMDSAAEPDRVQVQVLYAGKKGWTAIASHPDAPGKNCVIYVGQRTSLPLVPRTRADARDATAEGQPACDR